MYPKQVMSPDHPLWREFISTLSHARVCLGTTVYSRHALAKFPEIDVEESLRALEIMGGKCDCAIEHDIAPLRAAETAS